MKETPITVFADTGADVSVISVSLVAELKLPLAKTRVQIKPYGTNKPLRAVGYYVGPIRYKDIVANVGMYVVKGEVETLLSGKA